MGLADRDYVRADYQSPRRASRVWSITAWLIAINVAVFVADHVLDRMGVHYNLHLPPATLIAGDDKPILVNVPPEQMPLLEGIGHFSVGTAVLHLQVWRFITFQFLHDFTNLSHIVFNMIALVVFGKLVEGFLGRRRFLVFYLLCGVCGPIAMMFFQATGVLSHPTAHTAYGVTVLTSASYTPLVGASAGIFGILIAAARIAPDATVLIYGIIPAKLRTLAWIFVGIAVVTVFTSGKNAGGEAAHLGGAVMGFLLMQYPRWLNFTDMRWLPGKRGGPRRAPDYMNYRA